MKTHVLVHLVPAVCFALILPSAASAQAIAWKAPTGIQGDSDISTTGTPFDAIQAYAGENVQGSGHGPAPIKIGDTAFNVVHGSGSTYGDDKISFTTGGNAQFFNANPQPDRDRLHSQFPTGGRASADYSAVVGNGAYFNSGPVGSIDLQGLAPGHYYQVQIWGFVQDDAKSLTTFTDAGGNEAVLDAAKGVPQKGLLPADQSYGQSLLGSFKATGATAEIDWAAGDGSPYPLISAVAVRDISEVLDAHADADEAAATEQAANDPGAPAAAPIKDPPGFTDTDLWKNLTYAQVGKHRLKLDLYIPRNVSRPVPLVMYIHGGGWSALDKTEGFANFLPSRGFALASIDYRFSGEALFPAQVFDCKAAVRWLRAHAGQYPYAADKIGIIGDSAGGHLVSMLGVTNGNPAFEGDEGNPGVSSSVQAVCDYFGPSDFMTMDPAVADHAVPRLIGGLPADIPDKAKAASPLTYVSAKSAPFVIVQGDKDNIVAPDQSIRLNDALQKAGVDSQLYIIKGAGHGAQDDHSRDLDVALFNKYLR